MKLKKQTLLDYNFTLTLKTNNIQTHNKYVKKKCLKTLDILHVVAHLDWGADRAVLLQLYQALVRSKLDYGGIVYGSTSSSYTFNNPTVR